MLNISIPRDVKVKLYNFKDYFKGFEKLEIVKEIFGEDTDKVLNNLKVEFCHFRRGFMWICDDVVYRFILYFHVLESDM